jgi:type IV pilus assembly protein PilA
MATSDAPLFCGPVVDPKARFSNPGNYLRRYGDLVASEIIEGNIFMQRDSGFSLIELLIVIAIILVIAAIAIPNLLRARIAANESSAAASLRTLATAEITYSGAYPLFGYSGLANLGGPVPCTPSPASACIIDNVLSAGNKSGYTFAAAGLNAVNGANTQYVATAVPDSLSVTGVKGFCLAEDGVVRYLTPAGAPADHATCLSPAYSPIPL